MSRRWNHPYEDGAPAKSARAQALSQEVAAARAANHNAKLNQLADEATALKAYFDALRPRALAQAEVQQARQAYLARVSSLRQASGSAPPPQRAQERPQRDDHPEGNDQRARGLDCERRCRQRDSRRSRVVPGLALRQGERAVAAAFGLQARR